MHLFHPQNLKQAAAGRLKDSQGCQKVLLYFCGILLVLCLVLTGGNYILDDMMADAGGLGGLGKRTMISSFQKLLPGIRATMVLSNMFSTMFAPMHTTVSTAQKIAKNFQGCVAFRFAFL